MPCFIDNPNVEKKYREQYYYLIPNIKKSKYCKNCLSEYKEEVGPIDCPLSIDMNISGLRKFYKRFNNAWISRKYNKLAVSG